MADTLKSTTFSGTSLNKNTSVVVYTCPSNATSSVILSINVVNIVDTPISFSLLYDKQTVVDNLLQDDGTYAPGDGSYTGETSTVGQILLETDDELTLETSSDNVYIVKNVPIPVGTSLEIMSGQKFFMEANDKFEVSCTTDNAFELLLSYVERT